MESKVDKQTIPKSKKIVSKSDFYVSKLTN